LISKTQYVTECTESGSGYNPVATLGEGRNEYLGCIRGGELLGQSSANGICSLQLDLQTLELIRMSSWKMTGYGESLLQHVDTK
jgi:hypothetical protein